VAVQRAGDLTCLRGFALFEAIFQEPTLWQAVARVPTTRDRPGGSHPQRLIAGMSWGDLGAYRSPMRAFNRLTTPKGMGAIAEALRTTVGALRGARRQSSFAGIGPEAELLMAGYELYEQCTQVLMIGAASS
jgi:Aminoglycoside 3-N-acetyltransferase